MFKLKYTANVDGKQVQKEKEFGVEVYRHAAEAGMDLRQYLRTQCADWDVTAGDPIDQMMTNAGMMDAAHRVGPALTMAQMAGMTTAEGFRRPDGSDNSLGARLLYPQLILETLNANALRDDGSDILQIWESSIALTRNVNGNKVEQPIIDTSAPEGSRSGRIAQLAEPETMISITTGDQSFRIPTNSIGLLIANDAMAATTIDLVRIVMEAQSRGDKIRRVMEMFKSMVQGNIDMKLAPLPVTKIGTFDAAITANGQITKRAYLKWLHSVQEVCNVSRVFTDIDTALTLDDAFLPKQTGTDSAKISGSWGGVNLGITQPNIVPLKPDVFGASLLVGMDPRYAIQRFVNITAAYEAIEEYVMRKATGFRVDYGESATRLHDEAWSVVSLEKA
jgi:hypothetical protein